MAENHVADDEYEEDMDLSECSRFSLFEILARRDDQDMAPVLDFLERVVKIWRARVKSGADEEASEANKLLREHLLAALTLRWNAPFKEIRQRMTKLLKEAAVSEWRLARSAGVSCGFTGQCARVSRPTVSQAVRTNVLYNIVLMASASGKGKTRRRRRW